MTIDLYTYSKRYNSTSIPVTASQTFTNVNLKEQCSVINPVIVFAVSSFPVPTVAPTIYNYAHIAKFQRYYFIDDWVYANGVWEAHMSVDVLGSNKTGIGTVSTMVERSASYYDGNVVDNFYPKKTNSTITSSSMSSSFLGVTVSSGCFVLGIAGAPLDNSISVYNSIGGVNYYAVDLSGLKSICAYMFSDSVWNVAGITDISKGLFQSMFNPLQYIVSCMWFPFHAYELSSTTARNIYLGYWNTGVTGYPVDVYGMTTNITAQIPAHPQVSRGAYLNYNPYTKVTIFIPVFGTIPIDLSFRPYGDYVRARYLIDPHTGLADLKVCLCTQAELSNSTDGNVFYMASGMFGVPIQLTQAITQVMSATSGSVVDNVINTLPNFLVKALGTSQLLGFNYEGGYPTVTSSGSNGSFLLSISQPTIVTEHFLLTDEDLAEFGRPLMQVKTINTLSGYVKCADAHVELPITDEERKKIVTLMNNGFFYE